MRKLLGTFVVSMLFCCNAFAAKYTLLDAVIVTGAGAAYQIPVSPPPINRTFQAHGTTSAGSGACAVKVQGSNDGSKWLDIATITLTLGTTSTNDGFASAAVWPYVRGNVASISGTTGTCSLTVAY